MNCPICHAEMVLDYKIKIENGKRKTTRKK